MEMRWRGLLLALCALGLLVVFFDAADIYGLGGRPWRGFWDATVVTTSQPYLTVAAQPRPGGASAAAGIRNGDVINLREQTMRARYEWIYELMATQPTPLIVHRGNQRFIANVTGSTAVEGPWAFKLTGLLASQIAILFFLSCAALIALRRAGSYEARVVAFVLLLQMGSLLGPSVAVPDAFVSLVFRLIDAACTLASSWLLVHLASHFGARHARRRAIEWCAYALSALAFIRGVVSVAGIATLWFDPLPYLPPAVISSSWYPLLWSVEPVAALVAVVAAAAAAVGSTTGSERVRTAWLLLPLPIAFALGSVVSLSTLLNASWFLFSGAIVGRGFVLLLGALTVTYALLKRRVLDFEFILGRTLVVATVSVMVVAAFVLLEWLLGTVLSNVGHTTGVVANATLALALGLSLRYIHRRVDTLVDTVLFRKRHEDERALANFSKEAAYVTDLNALLDTTLENIRRHTDARDAALLAEGDGSYDAVRSFGNGAGVPAVSENDEAILALKTWHKPIDPHRYVTSLHGALALPMLSRGRLTAILLLGERVGGEAYAPDEIEALSQFAHGVGSALEVLRKKGDDENADLRGLIVELAAEVRALPKQLFEEIARQGPAT
ncbi:MAG TPA: GAF domain-containing protein [Candidatus Baltobacteraceae bacterium]|jgi:hypothetical protein|nr:GAF domain-containing protein [Candidatus Baltobacteraceae bacterium]